MALAAARAYGCQWLWVQAAEGWWCAGDACVMRGGPLLAGLVCTTPLDRSAGSWDCFTTQQATHSSVLSYKLLHLPPQVHRLLGQLCPLCTGLPTVDPHSSPPNHCVRSAESWDCFTKFQELAAKSVSPEVLQAAQDFPCWERLVELWPGMSAHDYTAVRGRLACAGLHVCARGRVGGWVGGWVVRRDLEGCGGLQSPYGGEGPAHSSAVGRGAASTQGLPQPKCTPEACAVCCTRWACATGCVRELLTLASPHSHLLKPACPTPPYHAMPCHRAVLHADRVRGRVLCAALRVRLRVRGQRELGQ